ncbi:Fur family transcriptional regulator [Thiomicrorhabdus heinhorstiae]|uniref:Transcriptional repressor n=1 Tax=Thiomicrorhabdus heinhorstiae TaxID=2748010 RepID=A0ABS0BYA0_9GAMM|nr:Fur family transcriptional regulator [Thiomicrorhabdus heinhorstiae]MBF6058773.1 transcriptional repressor [Thiomicrorhabdus heinhorstiae]
MDSLEQNLTQVRIQCQNNGVKLTPLREQVLRIMLQNTQPQSAYEILQSYQNEYNPKAQPMTIYRALNFLEQIDAVHRLSSTRQYIVCDHLGHGHSHHGFTQFLICDECGQLQEIEMEESIWQKLLNEAAAYQFTPNSTAIEIHGLCRQCASSI